MKQKLTGLSQRYVKALRDFLKQGPRASVQPAVRLGRQAVTLGLETLDLARMHEQALAALELSGNRNGLMHRAGNFFTGAVTPIEETHRIAQETKVHVSRLKETLAERTEKQAAAHRDSQRDAARRKVLADAFENDRARRRKCLEEALELQQRLQLLTHRALAVQQRKRRKVSRELQSEIAQTLLGINVRLLSLKPEAWSSPNGRMNEIASPQPLVANLVTSARTFACEPGLHQPARWDQSGPTR